MLYMLPSPMWFVHCSFGMPQYTVNVETPIGRLLITFLTVTLLKKYPFLSALFQFKSWMAVLENDNNLFQRR